MTESKKIKDRIPLLAIFLICVIAGGTVAFILNNRQSDDSAKIVPTKPPQKPLQDIPYELTFEGDVVCLPKKDNKGPQTTECMYGLETDTDMYYVLDAGNVNPPPYKTGDRISARGVVTPVENLSSDHWQKYNIKGIFSIKDSLTIL